MQNRFGRLIQPLFKNSFYHQGFFAVKRRAVFILGAKCTITTPNAKHSTLLQGCFFSVFVFDSIHDSVTMHGVSHHLASPMAASAFVPIPIGGFSMES